LTGSGHENTVYELSGKPLTQEEIASVLGTVLEKEVTVLQLDDAAYAETMSSAGVPDFVIPILLAIQKSIREGSLDVESDDFKKLIGHPATQINEALAQIVKGLATISRGT
jgi:NAD(P)H dehydrogenase (quinone)